jgi:prevent-host-death family protein
MKDSLEKIIHTCQARDNLADVINRAAYGNSPTVLTRRGKKIAVVISYEMYRNFYPEMVDSTGS